MNTLQFIVFKKNGTLSINGEKYSIPPNHLVVSEDITQMDDWPKEDCIILTCYPGHLIFLQQDLIIQAAKCRQETLQTESYKKMPLDKMMIACLEGLLSMDSALSAGFLYLYCLGLDKPYFSELLCRFIGLNISHTLFDFFQQHYLRKWTVSRYARELGISSHKLNALFSERYGLPAKKWLTQQRLKKGCELLLTTTMPVAEIARRCGFSNHAHFSAIFRRHFKTNPSAFRERARHS